MCQDFRQQDEPSRELSIVTVLEQGPAAALAVWQRMPEATRTACCGCPSLQASTTCVTHRMSAYLILRGRHCLQEQSTRTINSSSMLSLCSCWWSQPVAGSCQPAAAHVQPNARTPCQPCTVPPNRHVGADTPGLRRPQALRHT